MVAHVALHLLEILLNHLLKDLDHFHLRMMMITYCVQDAGLLDIVVQEGLNQIIQVGRTEQ